MRAHWGLFGVVVWLLVAVVVVACEPTAAPVFPNRTRPPAATIRPTAAPSGVAGSPGGSGSASGGPPPTAAAPHPTGSPLVAIEGDVITVLGRGDKNTDILELDGAYNFVASPCPGTGVIPFVWVYEEFGQSRGTYVAAEFTVKNLVGRFYLRISGAPTCEWTIVVTKA